MLMFAQSSFKGKASLIIPYFDLGVIWACDDERLGRVDNDSSDEVIMGFKRFYFLHCIVVEDSDLEIVTSGNNPVLTA